MISESLTFLASEVNKFIDPNATDPKLVIGNIAKAADSDGSSLNNKLILSLINIEEDKIAKVRENYTQTAKGIVYKNPPILVNLYILIAANFSTYTDSLVWISRVVQFFQAQNVFTPTSHPALDPRIEKLNTDLFTLNFEQINHIWSTLGGKYLPSAMFKIRQLTMEDENAPSTDGKWIKEVITNTNRVS